MNKDNNYYQTITLGMIFCGSSHHTANHRLTDVLYYFSIGYFYLLLLDAF